MDLSDISVIIPVYGDSPELIELIRGIRQQADEVTVIIVDDCSPQPFGFSKIPQELRSLVRVIHRKENGGFGAAVNTGLRNTETELALVLNSDLELMPEFFSELIKGYSPLHPAVMGTQQVKPGGKTVYPARKWPTAMQQIIEWLVPLAGLRNKPFMHEAVGQNFKASTSNRISNVDWVSGAVMLMPVQPVLAIGGFDETFFMYCEEVDLQKRLSDRGIHAYLNPNATVIHEGGGSAESTQRREWLVNARDYYARKHFINPWGLRIGLFLASGINLVWNTLRRMFGRNVKPLHVFGYETSLIVSSITVIKK